MKKQILAAMLLHLTLLGTWLLTGCQAETETDALTEISIPEMPTVDGIAQKKTGPSATEESTASAGPTNHLAQESSPYLQLHKHNPVDWYPWGPAAFAKAKEENKPIFLSVGYSSCYWCHVMERLVFQNEEIARYLNEHFVSIKVDREERPDIDDIYMTALLVIYQGQGGGWPMSLFLLPDGRPFQGGTYFPPYDKAGQTGFDTVMKKIVAYWENDQEALVKSADFITQNVERIQKPVLSLKKPKLDQALVLASIDAVKSSYDAEHGGVDFSGPDSPKFPVPVKLAFLQYAVTRHGDQAADKMLKHTLDRMAAGGIYDHLAGGFHRYSTDREWLVPHFEKMLYDQAQLAQVYVDAFRKTSNPLYRQVAAGILDFVLRDMTDTKGGFHSAIDAETDHVEGKYYVWQPAEIEAQLTPEQAKLFRAYYSIDDPSPFEHGHILHWTKPLSEIADQFGLSKIEAETTLRSARLKLWQYRNQRELPLKDDKVLVGWNGLMIQAFAKAARLLNRDDYLQAAQRAVGFIVAEMRDEKGNLRRSWRGGNASLNAYLTDYAYLISGLLELHQTTGDEKWFNAARRLMDDQIDMFWDQDSGGFYFTSHNHEELIARTKTAYESVMPSGNSVSVRNLIRIASISGESRYKQYAQDILNLFSASLERSPRRMTNMALALGEFLDDPDYAQAISSPVLTDNSNVVNAVDDTRTSSPNTEIPDTQVVQTADTNSEKELVQAKAYLSLDKLPAGKTCDVVLLLDIEKEWHINTNPAQPDFLIPTRFDMQFRHGSKLANVEYPPGKKMIVEGLDEPQLYYENRIAIYGTIQVPANAAGKTEEMEIVVQYQPCTKNKCLMKKTIKLSGKLPVAAPGEPVKAINRNLFPPQSGKRSTRGRQ